MIRSLFLSGMVLLSAAVTVADEPGVTYREPFRPQIHFTPAKNWMNDPNGMVYYDGEYHLFYQYNPFGDRWGHMSWGHAISRDLLHWEHLPVALAEEDGIMIFSGSAVVDWKNTSGFGKDGKPPLIAIYTGHREGRQDQRIAYSNDRGRTWTKFAGNPVLDLKMADFRDPKVFWHEPISRWIMTVALAAEQKVHFYASPNLKEWKYVGEFGPAGATNGLWECPDLFPLSVESSEGRVTQKWVLIVNINPGGPAGGSGCQYFVGNFDGEKFTPDPPSASRAEFVPEGKVLADFENGYGDWKVEGEAFGAGPASGTLPDQQPVLGFRGRGFVDSYHGGDGSRGKLTSPEFEISARHISFLIGGGSHRETRLELVVDGQAVRTASGKNQERLTWHSWDVSDLQKKRGTLRIVDEHERGWGHINVDHIILADEAARPADESALWADYGADFYAGVSWSDVPKADGRRLWLGWMSNWQYANDVPTSPWRSAMSIPRELRLLETPGGLRLGQRPVAELQKLRGPRQHFAGGTTAEANAWLKEAKTGDVPLEMTVTLEAASHGEQGAKLLAGNGEATVVTVNRDKGIVTLDRTRSGNVTFQKDFVKVQSAPLEERDKPVTLRLFVDTSSIEVFVNDGKQSITSLVFPSQGNRGIEFFATDPAGRVSNVDLWALKSAWK